MADLAGRLWEARRGGTLVETAARRELAGLDDAYRVQERAVQASGHARAGWKVGSTSAEARRKLGTDRPGAGALLEPFCFADGADVPADFYAGIAASPAGVFVARARAFHNSATASFHVKGNEKDGKTQIAARMRRGALAIENALGENPDMLERAVARAASARSKKETSLGSLWDVRAAAAALGA